VTPVPAVALGYQGFANVGDEAILAGIEHLLRGSPIEVVAVAGGDRAPISAFPAARRITSRRLLPSLAAVAAMRRARVLLVSGGGLLHDHWAIVIPRYLAWSLLARILGLRICWVGVGVGPIRRHWARWLAALTSRLAHLVTVRDDASAGWLRRVGVRREAEIVPDPAFFLEPVPHIGGGGLGLIVRPPVPSQRALESRLTDALAGLAGGRAAHQPITILTMERAFDATYAESLADAIEQAAGTRPEINPLPLDAPSTLAELARFDAVVSVRLHGLILCALAGTSCLPIVYDDKVAAAAARLGLGGIAVPLAEVDAKRLGDELDRACADTVRGAVQEALVALRGQGPHLLRLISAAAHG
jgi:polysaccharide pyruvyl transferase CsaB